MFVVFNKTSHLVQSMTDITGVCFL